MVPINQKTDMALRAGGAECSFVLGQKHVLVTVMALSENPFLLYKTLKTCCSSEKVNDVCTW